MCTPKVLLLVSLFTFFHCCSFSPCWPLAFRIFSPPIFMFFFQRNSRPLFFYFFYLPQFFVFLFFFLFNALALSLLSTSVKTFLFSRTWLCCCSFSLKCPGGPCNFPPKNPVLHLGCHTCWLSYYTLVYLWCRRERVRSRDDQNFWEA